jgi:predicted transposase YdaD
LKNAYAIANQHGWNREEFDLYIYQGIQIGKIKNSVETARFEGMEKGIKQGIEQGIEQGRALERQNTARLLAQQQLMVSNLLKTLPIEQVAAITGLSITDIQALL